ncbi:MAG: VCBS repeat-containing protein [Spirochaetales bacterium]|nr:VCBS repeat-containing protein [Spirochaetales bacterium]
MYFFNKICNVLLFVILSVFLFFSCKPIPNNPDSIVNDISNFEYNIDSIQNTYFNLLESARPEIEVIKKEYMAEQEGLSRKAVLREYVNEINNIYNNIYAEMEQKFGENWRNPEYYDASTAIEKPDRAIINETAYGVQWDSIDDCIDVAYRYTQFLGWINGNDLWYLYIYGRKLVGYDEHNELYVYIIQGNYISWEQQYTFDVGTNDMSPYAYNTIYTVNEYGSPYNIDHINMVLADDTNMIWDVEPGESWQLSPSCEMNVYDTYVGHIAGNTIFEGSVENVYFCGDVHRCNFTINNDDWPFIHDESESIVDGPFPVAEEPINAGGSYLLTNDNQTINLHDINVYTGWGNNLSWSRRHPTVLDVNADGRDDLLMRYPDSTYESFLFVSTGSGFSRYDIKTYAGWGNNGSWAKRIPTVLDVNADGRDDLLMRYPDGTYASFLFVSTGSGFNRYDIKTYAGWGNDVSWGKRIPTVLDANGDGRDDLLMRYPDSTYESFLFVSTGTGFNRYDIKTYAGWGNNGSWAKRIPTVLDVNNDGRDDLLMRYPNGTYESFLFVSTGTGFNRYDITDWAGWGNNVNWANRLPFVMDHDGDGFDGMFLQFQD